MNNNITEQLYIRTMNNLSLILLCLMFIFGLIWGIIIGGIFL